MGVKDKVILQPDEIIMNKIYLFRSKKIMVDRDLAELYGVETKRLKEAVRRNISRFPDDFMFEMNAEELENWRTQFASSNSDKIGLRHLIRLICLSTNQFRKQKTFILYYISECSSYISKI